MVCDQNKEREAQHAAHCTVPCRWSAGLGPGKALSQEQCLGLEIDEREIDIDHLADGIYLSGGPSPF